MQITNLTVTGGDTMPRNKISGWPYRDLKREYEKVTAQRDELLTALKDIAYAAHYPTEVAEVSQRVNENDVIGAIDKLAGRIWSVAQAAIAKAEGKQ